MTIEGQLEELTKMVDALLAAQGVQPMVLNPHQAARALSCHPNTVRDLEQRGLLRRVEWSDRPKFPVSQVRRLAESVTEAEALAAIEQGAA